MTLDRPALRRKIIELLEPELSALGCDLLDVRLFLGGGRLNIRLSFDVAGGVDLDACARVSRTAEALLEEARLVREAYVLEVSSPGVRRPLRTAAHFNAQLGRRVEVRWGPPARPRTTRGILSKVDRHGVTLRVEPAGDDATSAQRLSLEAAAQGKESTAFEAGQELVLPFTEIVGANLEPEVDYQELIHADRRRRRDEKREARRQAREDQRTRAARRRRPPVQ